MKLELQLEALAALGLKLNDNVSIDDLLYSFERSNYEERPFSLVLFSLGVEVERAPWGRPFCSHVWNFDTECINSTGDYTKIVERLCEVAGLSRAHFPNLADSVDLDTGEAWLQYTTPDGSHRNWSIEVNADWADMMTISYVMADIETPEHHFYFKDNGQAMVLFFLDEGISAKINSLSGGALSRVLPA